MSTKSCDKAWSRWREEGIDRYSFDLGFYEGSIAGRRFILLQAIVLPFLIGGVGSALTMWFLL